jgi:hypothetical protein
MSEPLKLALLAALRRILEPLARLMVDAGIGVGEFHELAKVAFVKAARERSSGSGKPNHSSIALLTGLRRVEVKALLDIDESIEPAPERNRHRAERVLAGWWSDPEFLDTQGRPKVLPAAGARGSFEALARKYSGEPRIRALRTELIRAKAVTRLPDGSLQALSRTFANARWEPSGVAVLGERVRDLLDTLVHNLRHPSRPRYARTVMSDRIDPKALALLQRDLSTSADVLCDTADDALHDPASNVGRTANTPAARLGLTVFVFEEAPRNPTRSGPALDSTESVAKSAATASPTRLRVARKRGIG